MVVVVVVGHYRPLVAHEGVVVVHQRNHWVVVPRVADDH